MNVNYIKPVLPLFTFSENLDKAPEEKESWATDMISMIKSSTTPAEFESQWKINPNYKLKMRGPLGPCHGGTALHMAVQKDNLDMVKFCIKKLGTKKVDLRDFGGETPLIKAVARRCIQSIKNETNLEIIHQLLKGGAEVNIVTPISSVRFDRFQESLLTNALKCSDLELTKVLLQYGARKLLVFSPEKNAFIKQKFTDKENEIYKQAKNENKIQSSNQKRIDEGKMMIEAKKLIEENKEQAGIYGMVDLGNTWMIGNYY